MKTCTHAWSWHTFVYLFRTICVPRYFICVPRYLCMHIVIMRSSMQISHPFTARVVLTSPLNANLLYSPLPRAEEFALNHLRTFVVKKLVAWNNLLSLNNLVDHAHHSLRGLHRPVYSYGPCFRCCFGHHPRLHLRNHYSVLLWNHDGLRHLCIYAGYILAQWRMANT